MKKIVLLLMTLSFCLVSNAQIYIPRQEIHYNVNYHWGLIDVMIARGVVTIQTDGNNFYGTLDGTSIPWEGRIICVSDTLSASFNTYDGIRENVYYQSGWYRHPHVSSFRNSTYNPDAPAIYKNIAGGGEYDASENSMEAITVTSDMIGMYYLSRLINFPELRPGDRVTVGIDGQYARSVEITYQGEGTYMADGNTYRTYDCTFEYSYGGGMSGYPVECKIGAVDRNPLYFCANLPVGRVEMLFDPS